jgi:hypothetical protein
MPDEGVYLLQHKRGERGRNRREKEREKERERWSGEIYVSPPGLVIADILCFPFG